MCTTAAVVVLVFRDIGQVREIGKRAHHRNGLFAGQLLQQFIQVGTGLYIGFATETHGGLAYGFNHFEYGIAFLVTQNVAQDTSE
ncbi:hypothetical protein D3C81_1896230 [compost metagenome]